MNLPYHTTAHDPKPALKISIFRIVVIGGSSELSIEIMHTGFNKSQLGIQESGNVDLQSPVAVSPGRRYRHLAARSGGEQNYFDRVIDQSVQRNFEQFFDNLFRSILFIST